MDFEEDLGLCERQRHFVRSCFLDFLRMNGLTLTD